MKTAKELELEQKLLYHERELHFFVQGKYKGVGLFDVLIPPSFIENAKIEIDKAKKELFSIKVKRIKIYGRTEQIRRRDLCMDTMYYEIVKNSSDYTLEEILIELIPLCDDSRIKEMFIRELNEIQEAVKNDNA